MRYLFSSHNLKNQTFPQLFFRTNNSTILISNQTLKSLQQISLDKNKCVWRKIILEKPSKTLRVRMRVHGGGGEGNGRYPPRNKDNLFESLFRVLGVHLGFFFWGGGLCPTLCCSRRSTTMLPSLLPKRKTKNNP